MRYFMISELLVNITATPVNSGTVLVDSFQIGNFIINNYITGSNYMQPSIAALTHRVLQLIMLSNRMFPWFSLPIAFTTIHFTYLEINQLRK